MSISRKAAIVGIGATEFSKNSGRSELRLAIEACNAALTDAGLSGEDVDGLVTYTMDNNPETDVFRGIGGRNLTHFSRVHFGGGAPGAIIAQAAMAVATRQASVVICYRAMNERSQYRFGQRLHTRSATDCGNGALWLLHAFRLDDAGKLGRDVSPAVHARDRRNERGFWAGRGCLPEFCCNQSESLVLISGRLLLKTIRPACWIAEPLRLLDCCQESDGAVALIVSTADRAAKLAQPPAFITAAAQGSPRSQQMMTSYYHNNIERLLEMELVAAQLYAQSALTSADIQTAVLYDHFTPFVLPQIEAFGFAKRHQAKDFVREGNLLGDGRLPTNTHGGQLGEGYIHGMNGVAEGVRQVRGSSVNQVKNVANVIVTGGTGVPTSGLILSTD